jgi:hypothetical protein
MLLLAVVAATPATIQMYLSPWVKNEYATVATTVFLEKFASLLVGPV